MRHKKYIYNKNDNIEDMKKKFIVINFQDLTRY